MASTPDNDISLVCLNDLTQQPLTRRTILHVYQNIKLHSIPWKVVKNSLSEALNQSLDEFSETVIRNSFARIQMHQAALLRAKQQVSLDTYLSVTYSLPILRGPCTKKDETTEDLESVAQCTRCVDLENKLHISERLCTKLEVENKFLADKCLKLQNSVISYRNLSSKAGTPHRLKQSLQRAASSVNLWKTKYHTLQAQKPNVDKVEKLKAKADLLKKFKKRLRDRKQKKKKRKEEQKDLQKNKCEHSSLSVREQKLSSSLSEAKGEIE